MNIVKSESAVSPVIGTILLVAIAVVLVAIILVVVMGFSGDTNEKKVGLNAKPATGNDASLILYGGASIPELVRLEMIDQGSPYGEYVILWDINEGEAFVGIPYLAEKVAQPEKDMDVYDTRINVRGTFSDGTNVILLVQPMTFYDVTFIPEEEPPFVTTSDTKITVPSITYTSLQTQMDVTVSYSDAEASPSKAWIYYQRADGTGEIMRIEVPVTSTSESGGSFSGTITDLNRNVAYTVWGAVEVPSVGKVAGDAGSKTTQTPVVGSIGKLRGNPIGSSHTIDSTAFQEGKLSMSYTNADEIPEEVFLCYRTGGVTVKIPYGSGDATPNGGVDQSGSITGLKRNTQHYVWVEIRMSNGDVVKGPEASVTTGSPYFNTVFRYSKNIGDDVYFFGVVKNLDESADAYVLYKLTYGTGDTEEVLVISGMPDLAVSPIFTLPGYSTGTSYTVWCEIRLPNGEILLRSGNVIN